MSPDRSLLIWLLNVYLHEVESAKKLTREKIIHIDLRFINKTRDKLLRLFSQWPKSHD